MQIYREAWRAKPLLRRIYNDFYDRMDAQAARDLRAPTLEIGGGIGAFKQRFPNVISTDIQVEAGLDLVTDAQRLPFEDGSLANIVMVDVLHHVQYPLLFLREAERVLAPGGRCVMVEPAITFGSTLFYRLFHPEPVVMRADPLLSGEPDTGRDPWDSNQAIPTLLVGRDRARLAQLVPSLSLRRADWFSLAAYPLSGGFKRWSLLPDRLGGWLLARERKLEPLIGRFLAFRVLIVLEKTGTPGSHA